MEPETGKNYWGPNEKWIASIPVVSIKLGACVVARLVYGPNYLEEGYASADWHTAKLMISLLWAGIIALSAGLLWSSYRSAKLLESSRDQLARSVCENRSRPMALNVLAAIHRYHRSTFVISSTRIVLDCSPQRK